MFNEKKRNNKLEGKF